MGQKRTNNQDYVNLFVNRAGRTDDYLGGQDGEDTEQVILSAKWRCNRLGVAWVILRLIPVNEAREWLHHHL